MKRIKFLISTLLLAACATTGPKTLSSKVECTLDCVGEIGASLPTIYLSNPNVDVDLDELDLDVPVDVPKSIPGLPEGFPEKDRFVDVSEACLTLTSELAPKKYQRQVYNWCEQRSWASSRNRIVTSKVDGSQIHDRDRFVGWKFYASGIRRGTIDPVNCVYHRLDRSIRHEQKERFWLKKNDGQFPNWPFGSPRMTDKKRDQWLSHPHDMERFSSRGPHDNHLSLAAMHVPGCWAPEAMDRFDVAATVTIKRSIAICEKHGCRTKKDIKQHW